MIDCRFVGSLTTPREKQIYTCAARYLVGDTQAIPNTDLVGKYFDFVIGTLDGRDVGIIAYNGSRLDVVYVLRPYRKSGVMRAMFKHLLTERDCLVWGSSDEAVPAYLAIGAECTDKERLFFKLRREDFND